MSQYHLHDSKGLGDILSDGVKAAAEKPGPEAQKFALHVKGVETPRQEPGANRGMALAHVTSARGVCKFSTVEAYALGPEDLAEGASLYFGRTITMKELLLIGERIVNLKRMYNVRHGMDRKDDALPDRFTRKPLTIYEEKGGALDRPGGKE